MIRSTPTRANYMLIISVTATIFDLRNNPMPDEDISSLNRGVVTFKPSALWGGGLEHAFFHIKTLENMTWFVRDITGSLKQRALYLFKPK